MRDLQSCKEFVKFRHEFNFKKYEIELINSGFLWFQTYFNKIFTFGYGNITQLNGIESN